MTHPSPENAGLTVEELATKIESFEATSLLDRSEIRMIVKALRSFHHAQQMPSRENIAQILARFHRNSCYPEAMDGELFAYADQIIAAFTSPAQQSPSSLYSYPNNEYDSAVAEVSALRATVSLMRGMLANSQCAPSRIDKGRAFYLAMYEKDGAIWAANDHKGLWCDMAEDYERRISAFTSPEQYDPAFVEEIKRAAAAPPEAEFGSAQEALDYLNGIAPLPPNIQPQCAPDREALVRAIQLSYARKDLEPTSATTLALYREDAENAADAVLALTRPLTSHEGKNP